MHKDYRDDKDYTMRFPAKLLAF